MEGYLDSLNPAQRQAVEHPPSTPLQILAGPGSGKTKVLTSRIAHLILRHSIPPSSICAVTFTNKAANEMRTRLQNLLGKDRLGELKMGTFHSLCARFLRRYAHTIGLSDNFSICDADEAKRIIKQLLKPYTELLAEKDMTLKEEFIMSKISKAKAKGITAVRFAAEVEQKLRERGNGLDDTFQEIQEKITMEVFQEYEKLLRQNNALDFDDLLLYGVRMFKQRREAVAWCQHVLVDEFQDTNIIQYDLMCTIAHRNSVTIVGDPDQSIYGWRSAEVANLSKMKIDFPGTQDIFLEENYRSTGSILRVSLAIIAEDKNRIQKSLHTSHPAGKTPILRPCTTEIDESTFIAVEIKRLMAHTGGLLQYEDFAILLRFNALSRVIESSLQKEGIPCRILGGHRFFERMEVKDLLAYIQLVDNPDFYPAFARAVNTPSRGVGEKTLLEIAFKADQFRISHLAVLERIFDGTIPDIRPPVKRKIASFIDTIRVLRDLAQKRTSPADIIRRLLKMIDYMEYLKKTQTDWETRWANVEELITFATEVGVDVSTTNTSDVPLRLFLQASSLSSEGDNDGDNKNSNKVTIATCHAAKGLEWPVVMIPSVEEGTFPFVRSDDIEEERRLLYVACTRAKGLLYLTHARRRRIAGIMIDVTRSSFVEQVFNKHSGILTYQFPELDVHDRVVLSNILRRKVPDEAEVARKVAEFNEAIRERDNVVNTLPLDDVPHAAMSPLASHATTFSHPIVPSPRQDGVLPETSHATAFRRPSVNIPNPRRLDHNQAPMPSFQTSNRMMLFHSLQRPFAQPTVPSFHDVSSSFTGTIKAPLQDPRVLGCSPTQPLDSTPDMPEMPYIHDVSGQTNTVRQREPLTPSFSDASGRPNEVRERESQTNQVNMTSPISKSYTTSTQSLEPDKKRRLGMGRVTGGYANKKFKLPY